VKVIPGVLRKAREKWKCWEGYKGGDKISYQTTVRKAKSCFTGILRQRSKKRSCMGSRQKRTEGAMLSSDEENSQRVPRQGARQSKMALWWESHRPQGGVRKAALGRRENPREKGDGTVKGGGGLCFEVWEDIACGTLFYKP